MNYKEQLEEYRKKYNKTYLSQDRRFYLHSSFDNEKDFWHFVLGENPSPDFIAKSINQIFESVNYLYIIRNLKIDVISTYKIYKNYSKEYGVKLLFCKSCLKELEHKNKLVISVFSLFNIQIMREYVASNIISIPRININAGTTLIGYTTELDNQNNFEYFTYYNFVVSGNIDILPDKSIMRSSDHTTKLFG